jgi:hypothetical protein
MASTRPSLLSRRVTRVIAVALASLVGRVTAFGSATDLDRCAAVKIKAAGKEAYGKAKCHQRAMLAGTPVEAACLASVESKLAVAVAKANFLGSCPGTVDALDFGTDECVASLLASVATTTISTSSTTTTTTPVESCCQGTSLCTQVATAADCAPFGGFTGPTGTVCDSTTGACAAPPVSGGPCCQIIGSLCLAGPSLSETTCTKFDGTFFAGATCTPSGCVP